MNPWIKSAATLAASCAMAPSALAAGMTGQIVEMAIDKDIGGNLVFIKLAGSKSNLPACHINASWDFVLPIVDAADKNMFAMLVAAKAAGQPVTVRGNNSCAPQFSSIEQALGARMIQP